MGIITLEHADRLFWLGRYTERVYTTLRLYEKSFDKIIDKDKYDYREFCKDIDIPDIYGSKEEFAKKYLFCAEDPNSVLSNLKRAYDNAIELREEIGSEALSYIQLSIYDMRKAAISNAPLIQLQDVIDHILAFFGIADDMIESENIRAIIKTGKRIERIDLYARLELDREDLRREIDRMRFRIKKTGMKYKESVIEDLQNLINEEKINYYKIVEEVENIFEI